jgi:AcrR family transcriptional regulator
VPNRAGELVWEEPGDEPAGLSRDRIVKCAISIADDRGLEAVSIRNVAAELQARPMSLYTHVASKSDLVALMLNEVSRELLVEGPRPSDWRAALREIAWTAYQAYMSHPWMLGVISKGTRVGPNQLRRAEQSAAAVESLSGDPSARWMALRIVHEWTIGYALHVVTLREDEQLRNQIRHASGSKFPHVSQVFRNQSAEGQDVMFDQALDTVLAGIAARLEEAGSPTPG